MADLAEIARRAGVTEAQARAVLDAAAAMEREPADTRMSDFATWAAGAVVVASVAVYIGVEDGYDLLDSGAGGALIVSLLLGLAMVGLTVLTWRRLSPPAGIRSSS
jgi:hypothetical protein